MLACIYVYAGVALRTKPRTSLCDLFSGPVPDFSKVHKISACSMPGGVQTEPVWPSKSWPKLKGAASPAHPVIPQGRIRPARDRQCCRQCGLGFCGDALFSPSGWLKSPPFDEVVTASICLAVLPSPKEKGGSTRREAGFPLIEGLF